MLIFKLCLPKIAVFQILAHYMAKCQQSTTMTGKSRVRFVSAIVIYHEISAFGITFNIIFFLPNPIFFSSSGAGSSAIDFTQLGNRKCFGTKQKTEISNSLLVFYLVPITLLVS